MVPADLESKRRAVGIADVDPQPILDVDDRDAATVDIKAVEAAIVDGDPSALVIPQDQVAARDQGVSDSQIGAKVTPDHYIVARRERAFGSLVPHGQRRRGWWSHQDQL